MLIEWSGPALDDLAELVEFISKDDPETASAVARRIFKSAERLKAFPGSGRPGRVEGTRELVIPDLPYILVYVASTDKVQIVRLLHGRRRWPVE